MSSIFVATIWGAFFAWSYSLSGPAQPVLIVCHAGLCAGGMTSNIPSFRLMAAFQATLLLPSVFVNLSTQTKGGVGLAILLLAYFGFLLSQGYQVHRRFWRTFELRVELASQNALLQDSNRGLQAAKDALETNQAMLLVAQAAGRLALWDWDIVTGFAQCNDQWFVLHCIHNGKNPVTFADWLATVHPEDRASAEAAAQHTLRDDAPYCSDYRILADDGRVRWVNSRGRVWRNSSGAAIRMVGASVDITERVETERLLRVHAEELQRETRAKSTFLAHMSHEIRTPMNGVLGMADLLATTALTEEQQGFVQTVRHAGASLLAVINDILDFSKIEAGKLAIEAIPFNLPLVLEECVQLLADGASAKGNVLRLHIDPNLPTWVVGDPGRLRQIALNLLSNAVKFTDHGAVTMRATGHLESVDVVKVEINVADTGIGIPEDAKLRLFQPFSQADTSTTRTHGGTGLGLTISRMLTEMMGGRIDLKSELKQGSTFTVTIPFPVFSDQGADGECNLQLARRTIVAFEVDAEDRSILDMQLQSLGLSVAWAESLEQFVRLAGTRKCSAALLSGERLSDGLWEAASALRRSAAGDVPVVFVTGARSADDQASVHKLGNATLLRKPIRRSVFHASIENLLLAVGATNVSDEESRIEPKVFVGTTGLKVLVAEDNLVNQRVASTMIERLGYEPRVVADGSLAVEAAKREEFAAILMDGHMPTMDGCEATRLIRSCVPGGGPPIIALTASALAGDREAFLAAGMNDYLAKPVQLDELARVLARWARPAETPAQSASQLIPLQ